MSITVGPFQYSINIDFKGERLVDLDPTLSQKEVIDWVSAMSEPTPFYSIWKAICRPLYTDKWSTFFKEFFFPSLTRGAFEADNLAKKILLTPFALALDIVSLPLRIITILAQGELKFPVHPLLEKLAKIGTDKNTIDKAFENGQLQLSVEMMKSKAEGTEGQHFKLKGDAGININPRTNWKNLTCYEYYAGAIKEESKLWIAVKPNIEDTIQGEEPALDFRNMIEKIKNQVPTLF